MLLARKHPDSGRIQLLHVNKRLRLLLVVKMTEHAHSCELTESLVHFTILYILFVCTHQTTYVYTYV